MVRFKQIIIILFMSLVFFNANAKNPPPGTGTADIPANILIMLDNSGSMRAMVQSSSALYYPTDMQTDSQGNIYILEYSYNRIKKYKSDGTFITEYNVYEDKKQNPKNLDYIKDVVQSGKSTPIQSGEIPNVQSLQQEE